MTHLHEVGSLSDEKDVTSKSASLYLPDCVKSKCTFSKR